MLEPHFRQARPSVKLATSHSLNHPLSFEEDALSTCSAYQPEALNAVVLDAVAGSSPDCERRVLAHPLQRVPACPDRPKNRPTASASRIHQLLRHWHCKEATLFTQPMALASLPLKWRQGLSVFLKIVFGTNCLGLVTHYAWVIDHPRSSPWHLEKLSPYMATFPCYLWQQQSCTL